MSLLIDLRMKPVTPRWATTGKEIFLQSIKKDLSFHSKGFFIPFALGWGYWNECGYNKTVGPSCYMLSGHMCIVSRQKCWVLHLWLWFSNSETKTYHGKILAQCHMLWTSSAFCATVLFTWFNVEHPYKDLFLHYEAYDHASSLWQIHHLFEYLNGMVGVLWSWKWWNWI